MMASHRVGSQAPSEFGGSFPWVEAAYKLKVAGGFSPLKWINKVCNLLLLPELSFAADGSLKRPGDSRALAVGDLVPRWRWDAQHSRIVINSFVKGKLLSWRWEELRPCDAGFAALSGVAHVGGASFSFSLARLPNGQVGSCSESLLVETGSFCGGNGCSAVLTLPSGKLDCSEEKIRKLAQVIDGMWLQELVIQSSAELLAFVAEAAVAPKEAAAEAAKICRGRPREVRQWAEESLRIRMQARGAVSLEGGLAGLQRSMELQLDEAFEGIIPLIDKLAQHREDVRATADRMRSNLEDELQTLNDLKEINCETYLLLGESRSHMAQQEWSIARSFLQAARSNPENCMLQRAAAAALVKVSQSFAERCMLEDGTLSESVLLDGVEFILGRIEVSNNVDVQHALRAIATLAHCQDISRCLRDLNGASTIANAIATCSWDEEREGGLGHLLESVKE
eukprot:gb/GFBE01057677.1/.p1 GENE.gb/GFBE01057677.1/~~gb/GFBE01057677.1/.p1  ORF type:complete len:453 (+),score=99.83 gb/GFBE01057677.1/:1-1359(+)